MAVRVRGTRSKNVNAWVKQNFPGLLPENDVVFPDSRAKRIQMDADKIANAVAKKVFGRES
jgi:hypothetical protein